MAMNGDHQIMGGSALTTIALIVERIMAVKTIAEQLEEVQTAITEVMAGQEVSRDGKTLRMADLPALERREKRLLVLYNRSQGRGSRHNIVLIRRD
jgi:hypothetical protein